MPRFHTGNVLSPEIVLPLDDEFDVVSRDRPWSPAMSVEPDAAGAPAASGLVTIRNVVKTFGEKQALNGVSFSVPPGQICGLLGPNGAGKTTLFRLLMGILKATSGEILVDGLDAFEDRVETKRRIGFLPDEPVFYSYLSARETLELSAAMHGLDVKATMERIAPAAAQLRLAADMDNFADDFSRGMKKKLGLLLAILHQPKLLILDEPTNGLDVEFDASVLRSHTGSGRARNDGSVLDASDGSRRAALLACRHHQRRRGDRQRVA